MCVFFFWKQNVEVLYLLWHHSTCSVFFFCRNTLLTFSSVKAGKTNDFALKARWRCFPWIISWPVTSGLRTPSSSTGRNPSHTIWPHLTSCCGWRMMALCSTPWGKTGLLIVPRINIYFPIIFTTNTWNPQSWWVRCVIQLEVGRWLKHPSACNTSLVMVFKTQAALIQPTHSYYMSQWRIDASLWCPDTVNWRSEEHEMFALTQGTGSFTPPPPISVSLHHRDLYFDRKTAWPTLLIAALTVPISYTVAMI